MFRSDRTLFAAFMLVVVLGIAATRASATTAPPKCPFQATELSDGCWSSYPLATTSIPDFFTGYAAQSGQGPYLVRPAWNVAGVDYPVGYYTPLAKLIDVRKSQPPGCALVAYGATTALSCTGSGALVISGYRFDLWGGTWLLINSTKYTSALVTNSYFLNGVSTDRNGGGLIVISNLNGNLTVTNSTLDGAGRTMTLGLWYLVEDTRGGPQNDIIEQNAFFRVPQKGIGTGTCGDTYIEYNYFEELEASSSHGEFTIDGVTSCRKNILNVSYNTMLSTAGLVRTGRGGITALIYLSGGNPARSWNHIIASYNTLVANNVGSATVYPGIGAATVSRIIEENYGVVAIDIRYINNFIDATGTLLCYYVPSPTPTSTIMQGNTSLIDGSAMDSFSDASCLNRNVSGLLGY